MRLTGLTDPFSDLVYAFFYIKTVLGGSGTTPWVKTPTVLSANPREDRVLSCGYDIRGH